MFPSTAGHQRKASKCEQALPTWESGALIGSIYNFSGLNIPTMADFKLSTYYFNVSLGRELHHNWLFQAESSHYCQLPFSSPSFFHFLLMMGKEVTTDVAGRTAKDRAPHGVCSLVSSWDFVFPSPPVHTLYLTFQWSLNSRISSEIK